MSDWHAQRGKLEDVRCQVPLRRLIRPTRLKTTLHRTALTARRLVQCDGPIALTQQRVRVGDDPQHSLDAAVRTQVRNCHALTRGRVKATGQRHYTKCPAPRLAVLHTVSALSRCGCPNTGCHVRGLNRLQRSLRASAAAGLAGQREPPQRSRRTLSSAARRETVTPSFENAVLPARTVPLEESFGRLSLIHI